VRSFVLVGAVVLANSAASAAPPPSAIAQPAPAPPPQASKATVGADEVICERQVVIGSRLAHRKVCMTRSQWEDARRQDREAVEKAQMQRGMGSGG
jgi:invasion protein IalB